MRNHHLPFVWLGLWLSLGHAPALAAAPAEPLTVIELFTSQGCSSCPPADALLTELAAQPGVLALAFHVDYWDYLGWRDRFGSALADERQRRYVQRLRLSGGFTPQAIINGSQSLVGSDHGGIRAALSHKAPIASITIATQLQTDELLIELRPAATSSEANVASNEPATVLLIPYLGQASSPVQRGENSGRTLTESNIVLGVRVLGSWNGRTARYVVPRNSMPTMATSVAVLVQSADQGPVQAAASIALR